MMRILQAMLFLLVHFILNHRVTANQEIRFKGPLVLNGSYETGISKTVLLNEALNIVFVNVTGITQFKCMEAVAPLGFTREAYVTTLSSTTFTISNITNNMSTKWRCTASVWISDGKYENDEPLNYLFEVKVKSAKIVKVTVNSMGLVLKNVSLAESEYDGIYEYHSEEDVFLDFKCSNAYADGRVQLQYFDAHGNLKFNTANEEGPFRVQKIMRSENHQSYIVCIYFSPLAGYQQEFKYKTVFLITTETHRQTDTVVKINNMKIVPTNDSLAAMDVYHYNFSYGEIKITCENDQQLASGQGAIEVNNIKGSYIKAYTSELTLDPKGHDQARVHCLSNQGTQLAEILLNKDTGQDPVIIGFPANDLLYQFNKNNETWEAHYLYSENKVMELKCVTTPDRILTWKVESTPPMPIQKTIKDKDEIEAYVESNFTFDSEHKDVRLVCEASKTKTKTRTVTVVLHQKPSKKQLPINNVKDITFQTAAACLVVVLLITLFTICLYYRRFRNNTPSVSEKPFKNFSDNTNPMPALPNQSETNEYTYITNENYKFNNIQTDVMKNNSIYFENKPPLPDVNTNNGCNNAPAEPLYSEIKENIALKNAKEMYAEPYDHSIKQLYAEPYDHCKQMDPMKKTYTVSYDKALVKNRATKIDKINPYFISDIEEKRNTSNKNLTSKGEVEIICKTDPEDNNDEKYSNLLTGDSTSNSNYVNLAEDDTNISNFNEGDSTGYMVVKE